MTAILPTRFVEKPWGRDVLPLPFAGIEGKRIGEIWFEPPAALPELLVKYLFTSERLSIQVHPDGEAGKEECWLVLDAEPGAVVGLGFREACSPETIREAALDGSIEHMLEWHAVAAGDFFHIPPGTVHAIGPGILLVEVQQNNGLTYRLYDYGRPRELHLDAAVTTARGAPNDQVLRRRLALKGNERLVEGPHFRLDRVTGIPDKGMAERYASPLLVIPLFGTFAVAGEAVAPGQCALARSFRDLDFDPTGQCLLAQPFAVEDEGRT